MGRTVLMIATLLLVPSLLSAQEKLPREAHRFWDRTNIMLHLVNAAAQSIDGYSTQHALRRNRKEMNPVAQPLVHRGWGGQAAYSFGLGIGGTLTASYLLHRLGYHRQERLTPLIVATPTAISAGLNLRF